MNIVEPYPGSSSDERFQLLKHLGSGAFAHTYKAHVLQNQWIESYKTDIVAIKIPLNIEKEMALQKEVAINAHLHLEMTEVQSRNLVCYLGFSVFRGQNVMVMEYIEQGSLRNKIGKLGYQKPLPIEEAVNITCGLLEGLAVIHRAHVFHRDIKPENILMKDNTPKISDLGIARMLESSDLASTTRGTIYYMSPEILGPEGASFPSDIWSLGVTLYEMVTGKLPFWKPRAGLGEMADLIRDGKYIPACQARPEVPEVLSNIIDRAMQKIPSHRYRSAEEMHQVLSHLEKGTNGGVERELAKVGEYANSLEQTSTVEKKLRAIVTKYSNEPRVYQRLGEFLNRCQRHTEAIQVFRQGLEVDADNALLHWDIAMAYLGAGRRQNAAQSLKTAASLGLGENRQRHAVNLLGKLQGNKKETASEIEQKVIEILDNQPLLEQTNVAEIKMRELVKKYSSEPRAYQVLGEFYNRCQRYAEAIQVFGQGLKLDPDNALLYWDIAMAYLGVGRREKAVRSLERAVSLGLDENRQRHSTNLIKMLRRNQV